MTNDMLNVQQFLQTHTLAELTAELGIKVREYDDCITLNYDQIASPNFHPVCDECRGLILAKGSWAPLARAFDRFYNYGQGNQSLTFPIEKATASQKIDGSLILLWFNPFADGWQCATRGMAFGEGEVREGLKTFAQLVEQALGCSVVERMADADRDLTFICELATPENRIVTPYTDYNLYLLSVRSLASTKELMPDEVTVWAERLQLPQPKQFSFASWHEIKQSASELPTMDEGYVCKYLRDDGFFWRIKLKNPAYLAVAHLRGNQVPGCRGICELIIRNDEEEYLNYFGEDRPLFAPWQVARDRCIEFANDLWERTKDTESQKDFALAVKDTPVGALMFQMRKGKSLSDLLLDINGERAEHLLRAFLPQE